MIAAAPNELCLLCSGLLLEMSRCSRTLPFFLRHPHLPPRIYFVSHHKNNDASHDLNKTKQTKPISADLQPGESCSGGGADGSGTALLYASLGEDGEEEEEKNTQHPHTHARTRRHTQHK